MYDCALIDSNRVDDSLVGSFNLSYVPRKGDHLDYRNRRYSVHMIVYSLETQKFLIFGRVIA